MLNALRPSETWKQLQWQTADEWNDKVRKMSSVEREALVEELKVERRKMFIRAFLHSAAISSITLVTYGVMIAVVDKFMED